MGEPAFLSTSEAVGEVGPDVGDRVDVGHAVRLLRMRRDMQAAPAGVLAPKNRLPDVQNFASFDVILQQHFVLINHQ